MNAPRRNIMSQPGGRPLQDQLDEVHHDMLVAARNPDKETGHSDADNHLTRLVKLLAHGRGLEVQRVSRLALGAYKRGTHWCA